MYCNHTYFKYDVHLFFHHSTFKSPRRVIYYSILNRVSLLPPTRDTLLAQLDLTVTKAESEQLARALQEEQYFELSQENKKTTARHKQEGTEKDATIARVSYSVPQYTLLSCIVNECQGKCIPTQE